MQDENNNPAEGSEETTATPEAGQAGESTATPTEGASM